jgi:TRAP-type C4-dicarboxylate transport system permease small subunit
VSEQPDEPEGDGTPDQKVDVPPTRKHELPDESKARTSQLSIAMAPPQYPDDGVVARAIRKIDHRIGSVEQGLLFALLAIVVLVAATAAVSDKLGGHQLGRWWHYIVRGGTFATAMFAAVFATQQQRHLAMDLVSRRLIPRGRLVLGVALKLLTIGVALLLFRSGLHQRAVAGGSEHLDFLGLRIIDADVVATISIGAALIALHSLLHILIDVDYLVRGKLPPERARSGH